MDKTCSPQLPPKRANYSNMHCRTPAPYTAAREVYNSALKSTSMAEVTSVLGTPVVYCGRGVLSRMAFDFVFFLPYALHFRRLVV